MLMAFVLVISSTRWGLGQDQQRSFPSDNLASAVLIEDSEGSGSGFFFSYHDAVYLVSARHVLFKPKHLPAGGLSADFEPIAHELTLTSYSQDPSDTSANVFKIDLDAVVQTAVAKYHRSQDVAIVKVAQLVPYSDEERKQNLTIGPTALKAVGVPGVTLQKASRKGLLGVSAENTKRLSETLIGNDIVVMGYPSSIGLADLKQIDYARPLVRRGALAGTNAANKSLVLDCQVFFGNSGGPVFEIDHQGLGYSFNLIGVVSQYVPFANTAGSQTVGVQILTNSGYAIAVPTDFIYELIDR
ncbi:trypsin-like peptidase domain-containing protein [Terriglobus sp. TAA 43]|uniref:trypsin-like peptidase domain-containing protein n=1 Tax=Terriglobus sp. TAA 43 TaxID=278961 RepID=UPI0006470FEB|nr:trypsin-like peptidase domain-containing protein [Terriglobus sp. TAA 43]